MDLTAEEARTRLREGNRRFLNDTPEAGGRDAARRAMLAKSQDPFAAVLCCADSRVVPEIVFDAGLGELFVIRVAGNVANKATIASMEYAVAILGTKLVVIMAHGNCGAVAAAMEGGGASPHLRYLLDHIQPAVECSQDRDVDAVARLSAKLNVQRMVAESAIIRNGVETGGVGIITAFYAPGSGEVDLV